MPKSVPCGVVCFLAIGSITAAWCAEADNGSLEGTWIGKSIEKDGKKAPEDAAKRMRFRFVGDKLFVRGNFDDERESECSFVLDDTEEPKHFDFTPPNKKPILAIYERKGKALKMCIRHASSDKGRPTEFKTSPGSDLVLVVFSLQKK